MTPEARLIHRTMSRVRVKIPGKKGDKAYFASVEALFRDHPEIESVDANPRTGSVLFATPMDVTALADIADEHGLFSLVAVPPERITLATSFSEAFRNGNKRLLRFTGGELDVASVVFLFMVVSGIYQVMRGNVTVPAWYAAFYYAHHFFDKIHHDESVSHEDTGIDPDGGE